MPKQWRIYKGVIEGWVVLRMSRPYGYKECEPQPWGRHEQGSGVWGCRHASFTEAMDCVRADQQAYIHARRRYAIRAQ